MHVAVLISSYEGSESALKDYDVKLSPAEHYPVNSLKFTTVEIKKSTAAKQICQLVRNGHYDVFLNLCDGAWDEDRAGPEVVQYLEQYGVAFTGACSTFYNMTKEHMKMVAHSCDIYTPQHVFAYCEEDIIAALSELTFPLIVKPFNGYSSVGMSADSKVADEHSLRREANRMIAEFGGALVEEFVDGPEFTVLVAENPDDAKQPIAFEPVQCVIKAKEGFKHFGIKMITWDTDLDWIPVKDEELKARLKDMSCRMFLGSKANSFGRVDVRMDLKTGKLFMLEINANCTVFCPPGQFGSADIILSMDPRGHRYFIDLIIASAFKKHKREQVKYKPVYKVASGYGMCAAVDILEGEIIDRFEAMPQTLVTLRNVKNNWDQQDLELFYKYAWPLSEDVYAIWSDDPNQWKPINHSCNPNAWLVGLNVAARRNIARGEAVSLDYGTFLGETMTPFKCNCGSQNCRLEVKPTDHLELFIGTMYGDHVSDYVRRKRMQNRLELERING